MQDDEKAVEAVARAMATANGEDPDELGPISGLPYWRAFEFDARAAIAAYRNHLEAEGMAAWLNSEVGKEIVND